MKAIGKRQYNEFAANARLHASVHGVQLDLNAPVEFERPSNWSEDEEKLAEQALKSAQARRIRPNG